MKAPRHHRQTDTSTQPAHERLIELVARRVYAMLRERNQQCSNVQIESQMLSNRIMRLKDVEERVGLKTTQIYHLMAIKQFPQSIKLSTRAVGWLEHEIDEWLLARAALRNGQ